MGARDDALLRCEHLPRADSYGVGSGSQAIRNPIPVEDAGGVAAAQIGTRSSVGSCEDLGGGVAAVGLSTVRFAECRHDHSRHVT